MCGRFGFLVNRLFGVRLFAGRTRFVKMLDESSVAVTGECEDAQDEYDGDDSGHAIFWGHLCCGTKSCQTLRHKRISRVLLG